MKKANLLLMAAAAMGMPSVAHAHSIETTEAKDSRPNLLYIFPDQYRMFALGIWSNPEYRNAISTMGDPVHTPNLDRLAQSGVLFTNACSTQPVSSPHRAMLMSGMYPSKNGIEKNCTVDNTEELKHDIVCFTDVLAKAGYETAYIGKTHWHNTEALFDEKGNYKGTTSLPGGSCPNRFDTYIPEGKSRHSNKFWFQQLNDSHYNALAYSNRPELVGGKKDGEVYRPKRFTTTVEADIIIDYLNNKGGVRDASKPFSLIWSINPPHPPYNRLSDCDENIFNEYYKDLSLDELLVRGNVGKNPELRKTKAGKNLPLSARFYFSLITGVDREIGRVLDALEKSGEADNTIIVFTSDHGEMMGSHGKTGKSVFYDESMLVPFILKYPGKLKHRTDDLMFGSTDIMPTMLGLMGMSDKIPSTVMGKDYSDGILTGKYKKNKKPESALYLSLLKKGVRTYKYTYVVKSDGTYELFDNVKDPYQKKSISLDSLTDKEVSFLKKSLGKWLKEACDPWVKQKLNSGLIEY